MLPQEERVRLLHGPYHPPRVRRGDIIFCEMRGMIRVIDFTDAPIPWPRGRGVENRKGGPAFIVCDDLVRAVRQESQAAVKHWWGVCSRTAYLWRVALGVERYNEGTRCLHGETMAEILTEERMTRFRQAASIPIVREQAAQTRRERGTQPNRVTWVSEQDAVLGTMSDTKAALALGRTVEAVRLRRHSLGIAPHDPKSWQVRAKDYVTLSAAQVRAQRFERGISQAEVSRRAKIDRAAYSDMENGLQQRVRPETLARLAQALECAAEELLAP